MKKNVYSVFDVKAAYYGQPFFMERDNVAVRMFGDLTNDPKSAINKHPEDYSLYHIGEYDDNSGKLIPMVPKPLVTAASLLKEKLIQPELFPKEK